MYPTMHLFFQSHNASDSWYFAIHNKSYLHAIKLATTSILLHDDQRETCLKGHWTTSASSPDIFSKMKWDFYTIRCVYLCSDCNLTCNFSLVTKMFELFLQQPFLKVDFQKWPPLLSTLNLAPSTNVHVWRKILKLVCAVFLNWYDKITEHYVNYDILI